MFVCRRGDMPIFLSQEGVVHGPLDSQVVRRSLMLSQKIMKRLGKLTQGNNFIMLPLIVGRWW